MIRAALLCCALMLVPPAAAQSHAPSLALRTGDGTAVALAQFKGRPFLVDFWASWCAPCLPGLKALQDLRGEYPVERLAIVPISLDRGGAVAAIRGYAKVGITRLPLYLAAPDDATARFAIKGLPLTILFDSQGREHARFDAGAKMRDHQIRRAVAELLTRPPSQGIRP